MKYVNGKGRELYLSGTATNMVGSTAAKETLVGTSKNDSFQGSGGDVLSGGLGDDTYVLWDSASTVIERAGEGIDTVRAQFWGAATLAANVENLILASAGSTAGTGNALDNIIIAGPVGATLDGKGGDDVLVGGNGADIFKVSAGNGSDAILNFKPGSDAILLSGYGIGTYSQLLKVAYQQGADVVLRFSGGESLAIRDVKLSDLSAYDFGFSTPFQHAAGNTVLVGAGVCHTYDGWYVLNNVWNAGGLKYGTDYTIDSSYSRADLTGSTTFNWSFPLVTEAYPTIRAYPEVIFGPAPLAGGARASDTAGVFPIKLDALSSLVIDYDVAFQGNKGGFNVAYDIWFTDTPNGGRSTTTTELMIWVHKGDFDAYGKVIGTYEDGDLKGKIYFSQGAEWNYIAVVLDDDRPVGQIDLAKMLKALQGLGVMSSSEYLASIQLGAEVVSGAGSLRINNLDFHVVERGNDGFDHVSEVSGSGTVKTLVPQVAPHPVEQVLEATPGHDTLLLDKAATVDLSNSSSQVVGSVRVIGFEKVDASASSGAVDMTGSQGANLLIGSAFADRIDGGAGDDFIDGGAGRDRLYGGAGNDHIVYDAADEIIDGGAGQDTLVLKHGAVVDLSRVGQSQVDGAAYVTGFEHVDASGASAGVTVTGSSASNTITGSNFADKLTGGAGSDVIQGGAGDDFIDGAAGRDQLFGGDGNDRIVYDRNDYVIDGGSGTDTLMLKESAVVNLGRFGTSQVDGGGYVTGFEAVDASAASGSVHVTASQYGSTITGSAFADTLLGGERYDVIQGGAGDDFIDGAAGRDQLFGGDGNDRIVYDRNDYVIDGGSGTDTLMLKESAVVNLGRFGTSQVDGGGYVTGFEAVDASAASGSVHVTASQYGSTITGSAFADTLLGGERYDVIQGGAGDDFIDGAAGRDQLFGGDGNDRIVYDRNDYVIDGGSGTDTLVLKESAVVNLGRFGTSQVDGGGYVTGFENVDASASSGAVTLRGSQYGNTLIGSAFDDTLAGGGSYDTLTGGAGRDVFLFDGALTTAGFARITDFSVRDDKIALDDAVFGLSLGALPTAAFHVGASATSAEQRIIYNNQTGELFFDADGSGGAAQPIHFATLNGHPALAASHFMVA